MMANSRLRAVGFHNLKTCDRLDESQMVWTPRQRAAGSTQALTGPRVAVAVHNGLRYDDHVSLKESTRVLLTSLTQYSTFVVSQQPTVLIREAFTPESSCRILQSTSTSSPATSILSLSKDAALGQKRPFSRPATIRQALRNGLWASPERSGGQCDFCLKRPAPHSFVVRSRPCTA